MVTPRRLNEDTTSSLFVIRRYWCVASTSRWAAVIFAKDASFSYQDTFSTASACAINATAVQTSRHIELMDYIPVAVKLPVSTTTVVAVARRVTHESLLPCSNLSSLACFPSVQRGAPLPSIHDGVAKQLVVARARAAGIRGQQFFNRGYPFFSVTAGLPTSGGAPPQPPTRPSKTIGARDAEQQQQ